MNFPAPDCFVLVCMCGKGYIDSWLNSHLVISVHQMHPDGGQEDFVESRDFSPTTTSPRSRSCRFLVLQYTEESLHPCCLSDRMGRSWNHCEISWSSHFLHGCSVVPEYNFGLQQTRRPPGFDEQKTVWPQALFPPEHWTDLFIVFKAFCVLLAVLFQRWYEESNMWDQDVILFSSWRLDYWIKSGCFIVGIWTETNIYSFIGNGRWIIHHTVILYSFENLQ